MSSQVYRYELSKTLVGVEHKAKGSDLHRDGFMR